MLKQIAFTLLMFCAFFAAQNLSAKQGSAQENVLSQTNIGPQGCGPCAFLNSLNVAGGEALMKMLEGETLEAKAKSFIEQFGKLQSVPYGELRTAYSADNGAADRDLRLMANAMFKAADQPELLGEYIVRKEGESVADFVSRFHKMIEESIEAGFHPILSVRALAAELTSDQSRKVWNSKGGHWIAIHGVENVSQDGLGFVMHFSDSGSGKNLDGYLIFDDSRKAVVPISFTVNKEGKEQWNWIPSTTTLSLVAPGMPLGTVNANWHERTFICVRYLIHKKAEK